MSVMAYFDPFRTQKSIIADMRLTTNETVTALVILTARISKTGECRLTVPDIARGTKLCDRSVQRALAALVTKNVLRIERAGRKSQFWFVMDDVEGDTESPTNGDTQSPQNSEKVTQSHPMGDTQSPRSLNIEEQSFSKENPSHAHTCAHAREDEPAPWEEAEKQPDPEDLEDLTPETISQRDLEESDWLFQEDIFDEPGTVERVARRCPYGAIKNLYHTILPELEPIRIDTRDRIRRVCVVWRELVNRQGCVTVNDGLKQVEAYFRKVRRSRIYDKAARNELKWQVDFSWLTKAETLVKVLEGGYD